MALGGLVIGFVAVRRLALSRAHIGSIKVAELTVTRLRVGELVVSGSIHERESCESAMER